MTRQGVMPGLAATIAANHRVDGRGGIVNSNEHIETQRLGTLSNTIFGVAMTLLAYRIPTAQFLNGPPVWSTIWAAYHSQFAALLLSFVVAGMFWVGHQRRLAYEPLATRSVVYLNLLFLLVDHRTTHHVRALRHVWERTRCYRTLFRPFGSDRRIERNPVASRMRAARPTGQGHRVDLRGRHLHRVDVRRIGRVTNVRSAIPMVRRVRGTGYRGNHGRAQARLDDDCGCCPK